MILKTDCRYFPGDRPCRFNKQSGTMCDDCGEYSPVGFKIIIIKLDAPGDVLRTTSLLPSLKHQFPNCHITWVTKNNSRDFFFHNDLVDNLLIFENPETLHRLMVEDFDLLIHPDASPVSAPLASIVMAKEKKGFGMNSFGKIYSFNPEADEWLEMGAFDEYKKRNTKTYQQIIHEIAGLEYRKSPIQLYLSLDEIKFKNKFYSEKNLSRYRFLVGLNTGASSRWQYKKWRLDGYIDLIKLLKQNPEIGILLYGGPEEEERNKTLLQHYPDLIDTGTRNSTRDFLSLLDMTDILVTGDTMALHAATALKKRVVCLFGPTSFNEIEDYELVHKIIPQMDCLVCYKQKCDFNPSCMDLISPEMVYDAINQSIIEVAALK